MGKTKYMRSMCFTLNNYTDKNLVDIQGMDFVTYGIYGKEIAPTTGTPHLQGYLKFDKRRSFKFIKTQFQLKDMSPHIEASKSSLAKNKEYCSKDGDITEWGTIPKQGKRNDIAEFLKAAETEDELTLARNFPNEFAKYNKAAAKVKQLATNQANNQEMKEEMNNAELRPWQQEVIDKLDEQDDRKVLWIYDQVGNTGKTFLSKYLVTHGAFYIQNGKSADIAFAFQDQDTVVFDLTRAKEDTMNYSIIESFKNGMLFSPKYESKTKVFNPCCVVVFSNWFPDLDKLSEDRWDIYDILNNKLNKLK